MAKALLKTGSYTLTLRCISPGRMPAFKGSALRGSLGHHLRRITCMARTQHCEGCLLRTGCLYIRLFEPEWNGRPLAPLASPPRPFILRPPMSTKQEFAEGDELEVGLILIGEANEYLPYFVFAFLRAAAQGIGAFDPQKATRFELTSVRALGREIYDPLSQRLAPGDWTQELALEPSPPAEGRLTLELISPLRLKDQGRLARELPFELVVRAALRRVGGLWSVYGSAPLEVDYKALVARARRVGVVDSRLSWQELPRYSNRQGTRMSLGGLTGSVTYEGEIGQFLGLLRLVELLHLGKQSTFGLGRLRLEWRPVGA